MKKPHNIMINYHIRKLWLSTMKPLVALQFWINLVPRVSLLCLPWSQKRDPGNEVGFGFDNLMTSHAQTLFLDGRKSKYQFSSVQFSLFICHKKYIKRSQQNLAIQTLMARRPKSPKEARGLIENGLPQIDNQIVVSEAKTNPSKLNRFISGQVLQILNQILTQLSLIQNIIENSPKLYLLSNETVSANFEKLASSASEIQTTEH